MTGNNVVAKLKDGRLIKGTTLDFNPDKNFFHVQVSPKETTEIIVTDLKAIFFVRKLEGDRSPHIGEALKESTAAAACLKAVTVIFFDDEVIKGCAQSLHFDRLGFFLVPDDPRSNNQRIFAVLPSVKKITMDGHTITITENMIPDRKCPACGKPVEHNWKFCPHDGSKLT